MIKLFLLLIVATGLSMAEQTCPWLNVATASGVLESPATLKATKSSCEFTAKTGRLEIEVLVTAGASERFSKLKAQCKAGAQALPAIGNEAAMCASRAAQEVVGRVRDQLFIIRLKMNGVKPEALADKGRVLAEQVS